MIGKLKYKLLQWLTSDITKKLVEQQGRLYISDIRVSLEIGHMAYRAWKLRPEDKEETE